MATAIKQAPSGRQRDHSAADGAPSEFLVFQSNSGDYGWEVVAESGATLARSGLFASFAEAEHAASRMRGGAASARFEPRTADRAPAARRTTTVRPSTER
jgi:uncharacterized protein YegP (UPF0339 family)